MYTKTNDKNVLINFDVENRHIEQLMGFALPQFPEDAGFQFCILLNCEKKYHPYENYIEMRPIGFSWKLLVVEVDDDFWYNLIQIAFQNKLIFLDGELRATELPIGQNKRFADIWDCDEFYSETRKHLMP